MPNLFPILIFILVVGISSFALFLYMKRTGAVASLKGSKEFYEPFMAHFEGNLRELGDVGGKYIFEGYYHGYRFSNYIGLPRKNTADSIAGIALVTNEIALMLEKESNQKLLVYTTSPGMVFSMTRIRSSSQEFEGKCFVYSDNPSEGKRILEDENRRNAILSLIENGWVDKVFSVIIIGKNDIQIQKFYDKTCSHPEFIKNTLDSLIILAKGL